MLDPEKSCLQANIHTGKQTAGQIDWQRDRLTDSTKQKRLNSVNLEMHGPLGNIHFVSFSAFKDCWYCPLSKQRSAGLDKSTIQ